MTLPTSKMSTEQKAGFWLAWMLTTIGFVVGLVGIASNQPIYLLMSLVFDVLDGMAARYFSASTQEGAGLDWTCDVTLAALICMKFLPIWCAFVVIAALFGLQGANILQNVRISGRTAATILAIAVHGGL